MKNNKFALTYFFLCFVVTICSIALAGGPNVLPSVNTSTLANQNGSNVTTWPVQRLSVSSGTTSICSIYPAGDTNTGLIFPMTGDQFGFYCGGSEIIYLNSGQIYFNKDVDRGGPVNSLRLRFNYDPRINPATSTLVCAANSPFNTGLGFPSAHEVGIQADGIQMALFSATGTIIASQTFMTPIGGSCIRLISDGSYSKGQVVKCSTATNTFTVTTTSDTSPIGVVYCNALTGSTTVAVNDQVWIVVSGMADVLADASGYKPGDVILTSDVTGGSAMFSSVIPPSTTAEHFREIGHSYQGAGASALGRVVLHFN